MKEIIEPSQMSEFKMLIKDLLEDLLNDDNEDSTIDRVDKTIPYVDVHPDLNHYKSLFHTNCYSTYDNVSGSCIIDVRSSQPIPFYEEKLFDKIGMDLNERVEHIKSLPNEKEVKIQINQEHISFLMKHVNFLKDFIYAYEMSLRNRCYKEIIEENKQKITTLLKQMIDEMEKPFVCL